MKKENLTKTPTNTKKVVAAVDGIYQFKLTIGDKVFVGKGASMLEALQSIDKPIKIFTKGDIEITNGNKKVLRTWVPIKIRRLFMKISQPILARQFEYLLK